MESRTSYELRTVDVKGFEPALASREKEKGLGQAPLPAAAVVLAKGAPEEDPFVVKLDQNDPSHPKVRTTLHFFCVPLDRLTIGGGTCLEPFEGQEMVFDDVGWNLGV